MLKSSDLKLAHELLSRVTWLDDAVKKFKQHATNPDFAKQINDQVGLDLTRILSTLKQESRVR